MFPMRGKHADCFKRALRSSAVMFAGSMKKSET